MPIPANTPEINLLLFMLSYFVNFCNNPSIVQGIIKSIDRKQRIPTCISKKKRQTVIAILIPIMPISRPKQRQHMGKQKSPICGALSGLLLHKGTFPNPFISFSNFCIIQE